MPEIEFRDLLWHGTVFPMKRWTSINAALEEFHSHLAVATPQLEIVAANDWEWSKEQYKEQRKTGIFSFM